MRGHSSSPRERKLTPEEMLSMPAGTRVHDAEGDTGEIVERKWPDGRIGRLVQWDNGCVSLCAGKKRYVVDLWIYEEER